MNENELVRNLKNGDLAALKRLIEKYQDYVYTIVFQIVKNNELAEEITQDVFIKVHQKIDTFEERAKFSTWLFTITYRLALNQVNKKNITVTESDYHSNSDESESPIDTIQFDVDQQIDFSRVALNARTKRQEYRTNRKKQLEKIEKLKNNMTEEDIQLFNEFKLLRARANQYI